MYEIIYTESALNDLEFHRRYDRKIVLDAVDENLISQPNVATRNRKKLRPDSISQWELKVGEFRVFYNLEENGGKVEVLAVGKKEHNKLFIRGKEFVV